VGPRSFTNQAKLWTKFGIRDLSTSFCLTKIKKKNIYQQNLLEKLSLSEANSERFKE
jgi:hypothetical protein